MKQLVVDSGFYTDPEQMKTLFVNLDFVKNENMLQGKICPMPYANNDMLKHIESIIGVPPDMSVFEFVPGSGTFISNQQDELPSRTVCIQYPEPNTQWVGIISLNKSEKPHYLKFYKHKRTGWDHVPMDMNELVQENINSYDDIEAFIVNENIDWADKWEETSQIELKVNEIVLFRPWMFHSYSDVFGDSQQTARLLQFFFLKPKQDLTNPEVPSTI